MLKSHGAPTMIHGSSRAVEYSGIRTEVCLQASSILPEGCVGTHTLQMMLLGTMQCSRLLMRCTTWWR